MNVRILVIEVECFDQFEYLGDLPSVGHGKRGNMTCDQLVKLVSHF